MANHPSLEELDRSISSETLHKSSAYSTRHKEQISYDEHSLNDKQRYALDKIVQGENVFITGGSGTGKSEMIKSIVRKLRSLGDKVAITSANLNGAISIGGQTIQSFCGIKKLDESWDNIKKEVQFKYVQSIWNGINVLILDDISMLSPYDFRKLLFVSQTARTIRQPIQWVILGDFLNLPPYGIKPFKEKDELEFCFQLPEWSKLIHTTVALDEDFRHAQDPVFRDILENIRMGASNQVKWVAKIQERLDQPFDSGVAFTKLYPKNESVDAENEQNFKKLTGPEYKFHAQKGYQIGNEVCPLFVPKSRQHLDKEVLKVVERLSINEYKRNFLLTFLQKYAVVDSTLMLKVGAVVILMANLNHKYGLIKGAQGIVTGFVYSATGVPRYPVVRFDTCECLIRSYMWTVDYSEGTKMWYAQIPLKLGWAYSIHRMRGITFNRVEVSMKDMFDYGQIYDVFSKVRSLKGITFTTINWSSIKAHPLCVEFYNTFRDEWETAYAKWKKQGKSCEVVEFSPHDHIPKAAFHMNASSSLFQVARGKPLDPSGKRAHHQIESEEKASREEKEEEEEEDVDNVHSTKRRKTSEVEEEESEEERKGEQDEKRKEEESEAEEESEERIHKPMEEEYYYSETDVEVD